MKDMEIQIDKKGLLSALEMAAAGLVIAVSAHIIAREIVLLSVPVPEQTILMTASAPPDENAFYVDPSREEPVFLDASTLAKKREALVWEKRGFLFADLDAAVISFYEKGALRAEFPIVSSPEAGSFFDTPAGFYTIQGKSERHISQIGTSRFSYAVYLFGNYLIHAVSSGRGSAAAGGAPVPILGGIQLRPDDAKYVFSRAEAGMPALVSRSDSPRDVSFSYFRKTLLPHRVPEVTAASALAADLDTGEILFEKNKNDAYPTASLTKLMTAVVAKDVMPSSRLLSVTDEALKTYGDSAGLARGEVFRAGDLLHPMILSSSNDIAAMYELAEPGFIKKMNEKAKEFGLTHTVFDDPSGLSKDNVTSAGDLYLFLKELDSRYPDILKISREKIYALASENKKKSHVWQNVNWPRDDKRFLGGKAGFTDDSLQTMAGVWSVRASEYGGRRIAITLLGSRTRIPDVRAIIRYLEQDFVYGFAFGEKPSGKFRAAILETVR